MRVLAVLAVGFFAAAGAWAQLSGPVTDPELTRYMDGASAAFKSAQAGAANANTIQAMSSILKKVNEAWQNVYGRYYTWASPDPNWRRDFDAISATLLAATNSLTPGNNIPQARSQLNTAAGTLQALRKRDGVPDIQGDAKVAGAALQNMTTVIQASGGVLTAQNLATIQAAYQQAYTSWQKFVQDAVDTNAFGLGQSQLNSLQQIVALQNLAFQTLNRALKDPNTATLLTNIQDIQTRLDALMGQFAPAAPTATTEVPAQSAIAPTDSGQEKGLGHRRFRLLR